MSYNVASLQEALIYLVRDANVLARTCKYFQSYFPARSRTLMTSHTLLRRL